MSPGLRLRGAVRGDLPAIVALLTDDALGVNRESAALADYEVAFADIEVSAGFDLVSGF